MMLGRVDSRSKFSLIKQDKTTRRDSFHDSVSILFPELGITRSIACHLRNIWRMRYSVKFC
jgi:hypothetical protein